MYGIQTILQKTWEQQAYRKMSSTQSPASGRKVFSHTFSSIHYHQKCLLWTIVLLSPSPCLSHLSFFPSITFSLIQTMLLTLQGVFPQGEYGYPPSQLTKVVNLPSPPLLHCPRLLQVGIPYPQPGDAPDTRQHLVLGLFQCNNNTKRIQGREFYLKNIFRTQNIKKIFNEKLHILVGYGPFKDLWTYNLDISFLLGAFLV